MISRQGYSIRSSVLETATWTRSDYHEVKKYGDRGFE